MEGLLRTILQMLSLLYFVRFFAPAVIGNLKFRPNNWGKKINIFMMGTIILELDLFVYQGLLLV